MESEPTESVADKMKGVLETPPPEEPYYEKLTPVDTKILPDQDIAFEADTGASPQESLKSAIERNRESARLEDGE